MMSFRESLGVISVFVWEKKVALNPFACSGECLTRAMKAHRPDSFAGFLM